MVSDTLPLGEAGPRVRPAPQSRRASRGSVLGIVHRDVHRSTAANALDPSRTRPQGRRHQRRGRHFHHYNIGIALLSAVGAVGLRGSDERRQHPAVAVAYGTANALVVDELALLLDLKDVSWSHDGRESVDVAIGVIASGATISAGMPLGWPHARRALHEQHKPTLKG